MPHLRERTPLARDPMRRPAPSDPAPATSVGRARARRDRPYAVARRARPPRFRWRRSVAESSCWAWRADWPTARPADGWGRPLRARYCHASRCRSRALCSRPRAGCSVACSRRTTGTSRQTGEAHREGPFRSSPRPWRAREGRNECSVLRTPRRRRPSPVSAPLDRTGPSGDSQNRRILSLSCVSTDRGPPNLQPGSSRCRPPR